MLTYIGHPLRDIGVATITAFCNKYRPEELSAADLQKMADFMHSEYPKSPLRSFLSIAFTSNAWFIQDAYNPDKPELSQEKRDERQQLRNLWASRHLMQWQQSADQNNEFDVFSREPAAPFELSGKLAPGRAARAQVPLMMGDESINFYPGGIPGINLSGLSLLCFQAMPLGCAKSAGRLLAVHSDNPEITFHFAKTFLEDNRRQVQLAQIEGSSKMPEPPLKHRTLLIDTLLRAEQMRHDARDGERPFTITAYHLSNSGQGPGLDIYHLPMQTIGFLQEMETAQYAGQWHRIVGRAWERAAATKKRGKDADRAFQPSRNWLYEDLFRLPENAKQFIRTYFLRMALQRVRDEFDPRADYSLQREVELVSWQITASFLRRIMHMEKERIEQIRTMGDRLAEYVSSQNDRRFFRQFYILQQYGHLRTLLVKANLAHVKRGYPPLVTLDPYIQVFEDGDELARRDWQLARDLVLIRMVERLHELKWLSANPDVIEDTPDVEEATD